MNWNLDKKDSVMIDKIVDRVSEGRISYDRLDTELDLTACHLN